MAKVAWVAALLLAVSLAGCSDGKKSETVVQDVEIPVADAGLGVIVGVVVDDAIRPVQGAKVAVTGQGGALDETETNAEGRFAYSNVEPGTYFVRVAKPGYRAAQQSFDVEADAKNPPVLRILLETDLENLPYAMELVFRGFIECSTTYVALCAVPNSASGLLGQPNITNDRFIQYYEIDAPDPTLVQSEMLWESTQALSDRLWLWHSFATEDGSFDGSFEHVTGPSPLLLQTLPEEMTGQEDIWQLVIRVFSGDVEGTTPPMCVVFCNGPGVSINQEFEVFTYVFYNYLPPTEWRFSASGPPPGPQ